MEVKDTNRKIAEEAAYEWWHSVDKEFVDIIDAYVNGVIYGWNNPIKLKEVDLEKKIDDYWCSLFCDYKMKRVVGHKFVPVPEYIDENFNQCENGKTQIAYVLEVDWKTDFNDKEWNGDDVIKFARYFYDLGLMSQKGE